MWLFWIVWACVCAPVSLHLCVCMRAHTHTYGCLRLYTVCARVRVSGCVSVPQYQILLSQLSARLSLVVICLSTSQPSASPSVSFSSFPRVFHLNPSVLHPSFDLTLSSLPHCFPVFFFFLLWASYCLFTPMPSPSLPLSYSTPLFLLKYFQSLTSLWLVFTSQPFFLKTLPWFFFFKILACGVKWNITQKNILYRMFSCLLYF